jgi:predicted kinase
MMEAIMLIGPQGAGKSSFYAQRFADTHLRLNRDMLHTNHRLDVLFHAALAVKQPIVLDNTHARRESRARFIICCKATGMRMIAYWFDVSVEDAIARNRRRTGKAQVPELAIRGLLAKLEPPTPDEGFDEIHRVRLVEQDGELAFVVEPLHPAQP